MSDHVLRPCVRNKGDIRWNCAIQPYMLYSPWNSPHQNTGVGSCFLLQGIFPTQGLNPRLPHCRQILCQPSYQGIPNHICCTNWNFFNCKKSVMKNWKLIFIQFSCFCVKAVWRKKEPRGSARWTVQELSYIFKWNSIWQAVRWLHNGFQSC